MRYRYGTVANPILRHAPEIRESGFQRTGEMGADGGAFEADRPLEAESLEATIQAHNQQLYERAGGFFELPLVVLTEQRDDALQRLANAETRAAEQRRSLVAEQDKFIGFLMTEHEARLRELRADCEQLRSELAATRTFGPPRPPFATLDSGWEEAPLELDAEQIDELQIEELPTDELQVGELQRALDAANTEVDETRADALRLQEERDDAIRATDDMRLELMNELESVRDEAFQLETRLDEANRLLDDARDQAQGEVQRLSEELADLRIEFDAQNEELRRLRARLVAQVVPTARAPRPG